MYSEGKQQAVNRKGCGVSGVRAIMYVVVDHKGLASVLTRSFAFEKMDDLGQMTPSAKLHFRMCKMEVGLSTNFTGFLRGIDR